MNNNYNTTIKTNFKTIIGTSNLVDFFINHDSIFKDNDIILIDLDYTIWNGNFDGIPTYDLKYSDHPKFLNGILQKFMSRGIKVFGFTGKPLFDQNGTETNGINRTNNALKLGNISFTTFFDTSFSTIKDIVVNSGVIYCNPVSEKKSTDAKSSCINNIGLICNAKQIHWIDDQDVDYVINKSFNYPVICYPFIHELGI